MITEYRNTDGSIEKFTPAQRVALQRARRWGNRTLVISYGGEPTYTDSQIADMCAGYAGMTSIRRTRHEPTCPYLVIDSRGTDQLCPSLTAALDAVREMGCDLITVPAGEHTAIYAYATECGITVLTEG